MSTPLSTRGRIRFHQGRAVLLPALPVPAEMVRAQMSVVSPGTERRHLARTTQGPGRDAGYMNLAHTPDRWALAPCPHGSAFAPTLPGTVTAPQEVPAHLMALARFQLMAARGLERIPDIDLENPMVVGAGPVAAGAISELRRRGVDRIHLWTRRPGTVLSYLPRLTRVTDPGRAGRLVVDTTGMVRRVLDAVRPGSVVGLLGTPGPEAIVDALAVHRAGVSVVGMHELAGLAPGDPTYQYTFDRVITWLSTWPEREVVASWCRTLPSEVAPEFYADLLQGPPAAEPIVLWEWT